MDFPLFFEDFSPFVWIFVRIGRFFRKMNTISEKFVKNATKYVAEGFEGLLKN